MSDTEKSREPEEPKGTTLSVEEWIEELNKYDRLHQYAKKRREESGEEKRKEPKEGTLTEDEWIELLSKHDSFDQYAKRRRKKVDRRKDASDDTG